MRERAHRARDFPDAQVFGCSVEAFQIASGLRVPDREFETEGDRLGMNPVRTADLDRVSEFERAALEYIAKANQARAQDRGGLFDLQRLRGIHDIVRCETVMKPA